MSDRKSLTSRLSTVSLSYWLPPFVWAGLIFYCSSLPGTVCPSPFSYADKVFHLIAYGILGYLLARAFAHYHPRKKVLFLATVVICVAYGIGDELHQYFVPDRCTSIADLVADGFGSALGTVVYVKWRKVG